mgnify:CR=1 FL=1
MTPQTVLSKVDLQNGGIVFFILSRDQLLFLLKQE